MTSDARALRAEPFWDLGEAMLGWIESNQAIVTLFFSAVVAASTVAYALLTRVLVRETVELREAETDPAVSVWLDPSERWHDIIYLVIRNHGRGAALNLSWTVDPPIAELKEWKLFFTDMAVLAGLAQLAPGQEIRTFFGQTSELLKEPVLPPIKLTATYETYRGQTYTAPFVLDVQQFRGITTLGNRPEDEIAKALDTIAKSIRRVSRGSRISVEVIGEEERRRKDRERMEDAARKMEDL